MNQTLTPEIIASGILMAAAVIYLFRLSFALWGRGKTGLALLTGIPAGLYGFGLIMAGLGFGAGFHPDTDLSIRPPTQTLIDGYADRPGN
ncbi:hypothetical protein N6L27_03430 [Leisingera sp. SS27]|uniref:hypothetical protein n=1 Tax=Leisingera sp. SS27 TaxID=2979462 RepID=UPI00232BB7DC|nr:hypothetical protein [Leisingera sp. SS27]MDC0657042.1 hypothetical protein [Leisingera sp. SS27]